MPATQFVQLNAPEDAWYWPTAQFWQLCADTMNEPAAQTAQEAAPLLDWKKPAEQATHEDDPVAPEAAE